MVEDPVLVLVRQRIRIEMRERSLAFAHLIGDLYTQLTKASQLPSGRRVVVVAAAVRQEGQIRAAVAWNTLISVLNATGKRLKDVLTVSGAKALVRSALEENAADVKGELDKLVRARLMPVPQFEKMAEDALAKTNSDIDIAFASSDAGVPTQGAQVLNIYQTHGIVQTGAGSTAQLTISSDGTQALKTALDAITDALRNAPDIDPRQRTDAIEVVDELQAEIRKPSPNRLRLVGALTGLASTVQTLGSAAAAYQILKGAAALVGVALP